MNEVALLKLEFDAIRETLATYCGSSLGKGLARTITPTTSASLVREWLNQVRELTVLTEEGGSLPPMGGITDIREYVRAAAFPAPLEAEALAHVAQTLAATAALREWFADSLDAAPSLSKLESRVSDLSPLAEAIYTAIDPRGEVRDYASAKLGSIRAAIESARGRIRTAFDRILRHTGITKMLQYGGATFHGDRMVLPLKAEYRGRIPGIIHRTSDSGATLFVEPAESVELNNTIVRLRDDENKEITSILRELTAKVRADTRRINNTLRAIAVLDFVAAKCRYAKKRSCVCPEIDESGILDIHQARHPLLIELFDRECGTGSQPERRTGSQSECGTGFQPVVGVGPASSRSQTGSKQVVPIDIRLGDDFDILILTGPNTGGKTVTLKTVGLFALMTQCGIPIPAGEGSKMPIYRDVFIDIGDEQSLQQSLSTFSSHLSTLLDILRRAGPDSLVLIDELGAGTDPDEGAAIGRAILSELLSCGAKTIVSTHLSALKAVAFTTDRVDNAAVEFDVESLKPTYHVRLGEPGNSNALIIAKRLGMPARLVQTAQGFLEDRTRALNKAIAGTLNSRREAEEARRVAREATIAAKRARELCERDREDLKKSQEAFKRWTEWINQLEPGDDVFLRTLKRSAKVVRMQLQQQTALVTAGAMDFEIPLRDIENPREIVD